MKFVAERAFRDTLRQAQTEKAKVTLHLESGATFTGFVLDAHDHNVILTELQGREFFDAVVKIDSIAAIETRSK